MAKPDYFKNALANFTFEAACGGAIRHLTDSGYSVTQIMERLQFPTSYDRVQKSSLGTPVRYRGHPSYPARQR